MQKLKERLELATGKKVSIHGKTAKVHVKKIDGLDIYNLNQICLDLVIPHEKMILKRSGTGITIIVTYDY